MSGPYDDIIHLPRHVSATRPPMSNAARAAQFAPFAALTGYDAAVKETARLTDRRRELDECEKAALDEELRDVARRLPERPRVLIGYFRPDSRKEGGAYLTAAGVVRKIDGFHRAVVMEDGLSIPIDDIFEIEPV